MRNASASVEEPGIARFDVLQDKEYPGRFVLVEVYREEAATKAHKATQHYKTWRETVESMMVEPRTKKIYENVYPGEEGLD